MLLPADAYLEATRALLKESPMWDRVLRYDGIAGDGAVAPALDKLMPLSRLMGSEITNSQWNLNSVFPQRLYEENGCSIQAMLKDERLDAERTFTAADSWRSFFGYMASPSPQIPQGMVQYWLDSWRQKINRSAPYFYFKVTDAHWAFEQIARNVRQPRSNRVATACLMGVSLIYDSKKDCLHFQLHMRSVQWSHLYGDIFGGAAMAEAMKNEVGVAQATVCVVAPKITMDQRTIAKKLLEELDG